MPEIPEHKIGIFWSHVDVKEAHECWPWMAHRLKGGYGHWGLTSWQVILAHRVAYFLANGEDPYPLGVLHKCIGSRACCNPDHLYAGTDAQNVRDRDEQGRQVTPRGERSPQAKLTNEMVWLIREEAANGTPTKALAGLFNISDGHVKAIVARKLWVHI